MAADEGFPGGVDEPEPEILLERRLEVAHPLELASALGGAPSGIEAPAAPGLGDVLAGERPGADRLVYALDLGEVERPARIADEDRARHLERRRRLPAAGRDGARPRREDLPTLEERLDARVVLVLLEGLEGLEPRIAVVEAHDIADVHAVVVEVIEKAPGVGARVRGPPQPVLDAPGAHPSGGQLPELLESERVGLRAVPAGELVTRDELLRERAARALGEHRERGVDLDARGEVGAGLALAGESHVADAHALDGAALTEEGRGGGEAREDLDAERLGAGGEPGGELPERDDVVAAIVEGRRVDNRARQEPDQKVRHRAPRAARGEDRELVLGRGHLHAGVLAAPLRQQ